MNPSDHIVTLWHQGRAMVNHLLGDVLPQMPAAPESTCRLPHEIVEMIIGYIADRSTLWACSSTCRSWYIATAPHIHHTLVLGRKEKPPSTCTEKKPLSRLNQCRTPLAVREIWVTQGRQVWFRPQAFSRRDLQNFSAFTKVQILKFRDLEIYRFIPGIERYFGHFSPTIQSITLYGPICTPRQLSHFLSFFPNLDNIEISGGCEPHSKTTLPDPELVPFSAPKLRGQLELYCCRLIKVWTYLITSCGGLRFRYMDLRYGRKSAPVLLGACANTLETLRFYATEHSIGK